MKISVTQREGVRYFSRFSEIANRDKLEVELTLEDKNGKVVKFDLTSALLEEYAKCPEVGRIDPEAASRVAVRNQKPFKIKGVMEISPAYLTESKKQKDEVLEKVREAQNKALEERKQKRAALAAARAKTLAKARKAKQEKEAEETRRSAAKKTVTAKASTAKPTASKAPVKAGSKPATASKVSTASKNGEAKVTKTQAAAIKKISDTLSKAEAKPNEKNTLRSPKPAAAAPKSATKTAAKPETPTRTTPKAAEKIKPETKAKTPAVKTAAAKSTAPKAEIKAAAAKAPVKAVKQPATKISKTKSAEKPEPPVKAPRSRKPNNAQPALL